jgi:hypothetical protein
MLPDVRQNRNFLTPKDFSSRALTGAPPALLWRRAPCSNELICDTAIETVEDGHQPVNGEASKIAHCGFAKTRWPSRRSVLRPVRVSEEIQDEH